MDNFYYMSEELYSLARELNCVSKSNPVQWLPIEVDPSDIYNAKVFHSEI